MAHKRKAREAFAQQAPVSAFAAARGSKQVHSGIHSLKPSLEDPSISAKYISAKTYDPELDDDDNDTPTNHLHDRSGYIHAGVFELEGESWLSATSSSLSILHQDDVSLCLSLRTDESLTIVGEYEVQILEGIVAIYGAVLRFGQQSHRVCAPSLHGLPVITGRKDGSVIKLSSVNSGLRGLARLSPLFRNLWNDISRDTRSFVILHQNLEQSQTKLASPLQITESCRKTLSKINARLQSDDRAPHIITIGSKSSGKSTFNRLVCNMIVSRPGTQRCYFLDLDPGQPEFGPPGVLSLVEVKAPILGPAFSHHAYTRSPQFGLVKRHALASTTFSHDPDHYIACANDLIRHVPPDVPLVVNTCGWVAGVGASTLLAVLSQLRDPEVVVLEPIDGSLLESLNASTRGLHRIARHPVEPALRTPAEQRAMHMMTYFHGRQHTANGKFRWTETAISNMRPWAASYSGSTPGIAAVLSYGQVPHPEFLSEILEGSIVAIVTAQQDNIDSSSIQRTNSENMPYCLANTDGFVGTLNPRYSECLGLALVRSINRQRQTIDLLTPLDDATMIGLAHEQVFLVRGSFDPADWALLEDLYGSDGISNDAYETPWLGRKDAMVGVEGAIWRLRHPPTRH